MICIEEDTKIKTTIFSKRINQQTCRHVKPEHPEYFKDSITYFQALRVKTICLAPTEYEKHCTTLTNKFEERGY